MNPSRCSDQGKINTDDIISINRHLYYIISTPANQAWVCFLYPKLRKD